MISKMSSIPRTPSLIMPGEKNGLEAARKLARINFMRISD